MADAPQSNQPANDAEIEQVVREVVSEAHVRVETLRPEEREYLEVKGHAGLGQGSYGRDSRAARAAWVCGARGEPLASVCSAPRARLAVALAPQQATERAFKAWGG